MKSIKYNQFNYNKGISHFISWCRHSPCHDGWHKDKHLWFRKCVHFLVKSCDGRIKQLRIYGRRKHIYSITKCQWYPRRPTVLHPSDQDAEKYYKWWHHTSWDDGEGLHAHSSRKIKNEVHFYVTLSRPLKATYLYKWESSCQPTKSISRSRVKTSSINYSSF